MTDLSPIPQVPVSWGELLDKIAILEIKRERIADPGKRGHVLRELALLARIAAPAEAARGLAPLRFRLKAVNRELWEIEDAIRLEESAGRFGPRFVQLARSVYLRNDHRAELKRRINLLLGSGLVEEKSYAGTARASSPSSSSAALTAAV